MRVAVLSNPDSGAHPPQLLGIQTAARRTGKQILPMDARTPDDIERAFATMAGKRADAVIVLNDTLFLQPHRQIAALALKYRLPSIYGNREQAEAGGLMACVAHAT